MIGRIKFKIVLEEKEILKLIKALCLLLIDGLLGCGSSYHVEAELVPHIIK